MLDLELATTDELFNELASRFDACVLATVVTKEMKTATNFGSDQTEFLFRGSRVTCIGLADIVRRRLLDDYSANAENVADDADEDD